MRKYCFKTWKTDICWSLARQQAKKGVFITTSNFSQGAKDYAHIIDSKVVLIDVEQLAQLMIDYAIGVSKIKSYDLKKDR